MIKKLILIFVILLQISCTDNNEKTINTNKTSNTKNNNIKETIVNTNILKHKPYYTLKIYDVNTKIFITLNGETIFDDYRLDEDNLEMPVNHYMTSGENILKVKFLASKRDNLTLSKNAYAKVELRVKTAGIYDKKSQIVTAIEFDNSKEKLEDKIKDSKKDGLYNSYNSFNLIKEDEISDVNISNTNIKILDETRTGSAYKGYTVSQNINLQVPFPRWKFLDSDDIMEGNYYHLSDDEYYKLLKTKKIQDIYALQEKLFHLIQDKKIDEVMPYFKERSHEMDIAMYKEKGYYENLVRKRLTDDVNDDNRVMLPWNPKKKYFYVSEGAKTLQITKSIIFNNKTHDGSTEYPIHFRYQEGKWIITR